MMPRLFGIVLVMLATTMAPGWAEEEKCPKKPAIHAEDWVSAWKMAKESCPDADTISLFFADRSGPTLRNIKVFGCLDIKAAGELLVITTAVSGEVRESVKIVRAADVIRIELAKEAGQP